MFLKTHSFPRATLSENGSLLGTDNVRGHISSIFLRQMEAIVYLYEKVSFIFIILSRHMMGVNFSVSKPYSFIQSTIKQIYLYM